MGGLNFSLSDKAELQESPFDLMFLQRIIAEKI
jgi:hypothetical protein